MNVVVVGCDGDQDLADVPVDHDTVVANELLLRSIQHSHTELQKCILNFPKYLHTALKKWFLAKDVPADWVPPCWLADVLQVWGNHVAECCNNNQGSHVTFSRQVEVMEKWQAACVGL